MAASRAVARRRIDVGVDSYVFGDAHHGAACRSGSAPLRGRILSQPFRISGDAAVARSSRLERTAHESSVHVIDALRARRYRNADLVLWTQRRTRRGGDRVEFYECHIRLDRCHVVFRRKHAIAPLDCGRIWLCGCADHIAAGIAVGVKWNVVGDVVVVRVGYGGGDGEIPVAHGLSGEHRGMDGHCVNRIIADPGIAGVVVADVATIGMADGHRGAGDVSTLSYGQGIKAGRCIGIIAVGLYAVNLGRNIRLSRIRRVAGQLDLGGWCGHHRECYLSRRS